MSEKPPSQAEGEAKRLLKEALETGKWFHLPEQLARLRSMIQRPDERQERMRFK